MTQSANGDDMKTVMDNFRKSTSEKTPSEMDSTRDAEGNTVIQHETIPGEQSHHVTQNQKRTVENSGSILSTTDDDLN
jgi:hypothetical protein